MKRGEGEAELISAGDSKFNGAHPLFKMAPFLVQKVFRLLQLQHTCLLGRRAISRRSSYVMMFIYVVFSEGLQAVKIMSTVHVHANT